jgi:predicted dehydrogenase
VKIGIIGYGWFSELLADHAFPDVPMLEVAAVCEPDPERRRHAAERHGVPGFDEAADLIDSGLCEAVAVVTPHDTHREIVVAACERGLHVFCEKAMAVTVDDCRAMIDAAETAGVVLTVGHKRRLRPPYARVAELVRSGRFGRPVAVDVDGFQWSPVFPGWWRSRARGGGLLYWTGIHDIDTMRYVLDDEVEEVYAASGPKVADATTDYEDHVAVVLRFRRGTVGSLQVMHLDPLRTFEESFSMRVACSAGSVRYDATGPTVEHATRSGGTDDAQPAREVEHFPHRDEDLYVAYRLELANFAAVVRGLEEPLLDGQNGLRTVAVLEAVSRSIASGRPAAVEAT